MAELMLGQPLFPGESGIDQLVEIIKVLGTPTRDQIRTMNPNYMEHKFPQIKPHPFNKVRRPVAWAICFGSLANLSLSSGLPQSLSRCDRPDLAPARIYPHSALVRDRGDVSPLLRRAERPEHSTAGLSSRQWCRQGSAQPIRLHSSR